MNLLSWNCQRLRNPRVVRNLCQLVKEKNPKVVFIMETKMHHNRLEFLKGKVGMEHMFVVDSVGWSGGLVLLWKDGLSVTIQNYIRCHINVLMKTADGGEEWKLTCFYGHPEVAKRKEAWSLLLYLG